MQALPAGGGMLAVIGSEHGAPGHRAGSTSVAIAALTATTRSCLLVRAGAHTIDCRRVAKAGCDAAPECVARIPFAADGADREAVRAGAGRRPSTGPAIPSSRIVTGRGAGDDIATSGYWLRQLLEPVQFAAGLRTLTSMDIDCTLEIGPHPVLSRLATAERIASEDEATRLAASRRRRAVQIARRARRVIRSGSEARLDGGPRTPGSAHGCGPRRTRFSVSLAGSLPRRTGWPGQVAPSRRGSASRARPPYDRYRVAAGDGRLGDRRHLRDWRRRLSRGRHECAAGTRRPLTSITRRRLFARCLQSGSRPGDVPSTPSPHDRARPASADLGASSRERRGSHRDPWPDAVVGLDSGRHGARERWEEGAERELQRGCPVSGSGRHVLQRRPEQRTRRERYRLVIETARFADRHGFSSVWVPERHYNPFGGLYPNPAVLHAALARETRQIRLMAGSIVLPLHHPLRAAEDWALVDNLLERQRRHLGRHRAGILTTSRCVRVSTAIDGSRRFGHLAALRRLWRGERIDAQSGSASQFRFGPNPSPVQPELPRLGHRRGQPRHVRARGRDRRAPSDAPARSGRRRPWRQDRPLSRCARQGRPRPATLDA